MLPRAVTVLAASLALAACSDDSPSDIDAPVDATDAAVDAIDGGGPCGDGYQMTGEYVDWDSTLTGFDGVEEAVWTVRGATPARTATTAPNGRIILCLERGATVTIDVVQAVTPPNGPYVSAVFVADPAVLSPAGGIFSARGLKRANADTSYAAIMSGMTFSDTAGHVLAVKRGTPGALTLGGAPSFVSDGDNDVTWVAGATGAFTLFPNVAIPGGGNTGTVTLGGTFTGPTSIPVEAGKLTIVPLAN